MRLWGLAAIAAAGSLSGAEPYEGWKGDYRGDEPETVLLWKFDAPDPQADVSGHGGGIARVVAPAVLGPDGKFGGALQIGGPLDVAAANNFAQGGAGVELPAQELSIEFWYQPEESIPNDGNGVCYLLDKMYDRSKAAGVQISYAPKTGVLTAFVGNGSEALGAKSAPLLWEKGRWYHVALAYQAAGGRLALFRDGERVGEAGNKQFGPLQTGAYPYRLGNRQGSYYGNAPGKYDNFRITAKAYNFAAH